MPTAWRRDFTVLSALFVLLLWPVLLVAGPFGVIALGIVLLTFANVRSAWETRREGSADDRAMTD